MIKPSVLHPQSDINITPMIDVLLVLIVIFMAALPLSQRGIDLNLPAETQSNALQAPPDQIVLEYSAERQLEINHHPVLLAELEGRLREIYAERRAKTLYIMGSGALRYGEIVEVIRSACRPSRSPSSPTDADRQLRAVRPR